MPQARRAFALQFGRFAVVGLANTATTYVAMWLFHAQLGIGVEVAGRSAYVVGAIQGFLLSRYWTFTHAGQGAVAAMRAARASKMPVSCSLSNMALSRNRSACTGPRGSAW